MMARALDSISNIEFKDFDLTKGQYLYVVRICEHPGIIQEKLADLIKVDRTTAARAIAKLEKNNFVEKRDDDVNRKIKKLYPTNKALAIYPSILNEHKHSENTAMTGFSEAEKVQIATALEKMRKNIEKDWEDVKKGKKRNY